MHQSYKFFLFLLVSVLVSNCGQPDSGKRDEQGPAARDSNPVIETNPVFHGSHEPKKKDAPFSDIVELGNLYFLSGQIGMDHTSRELVDGGIEVETKQALENIRAVLQQHGLDMNDVVKATVILDDINDFSAFNQIYVTYFPQKPARTTFAAEDLALGAKIEIEVIAVKTNTSDDLED